MAQWPQRGQQAPAYWDGVLRNYIDEGDSLVVVEDGSLTLDDAMPEGRLLGFRLKQETTVTGEGGQAILPAGAYTAERTDTGWLLYATAEGLPLGTAPVDPEDTTPPSAVSGLSLTANPDGTVTGTWAASTDESAVTYAWRVWLTSGGATGSYTTTASTTFTTAVLAPGDYTAQVYAYDVGSNSTSPSSATVTVAAPSGGDGGGNGEAQTVFSDSFTAANGTVLDGRTTPVGNRQWVKGAAWEGHNTEYRDLVVQSNVLFSDSSIGSPTYHHVDLSDLTPTDTLRISFDYTMNLGSQNAPGLIQFFGAAASGRWRVWLAPSEFGNSGAGSYQFDVTQNTATPAPHSGHAEITLSGTSLVLKVDNVVVVDATLAQPGRANEFTMNNMGGGTASSHTIDNMTVEVLP